jgi:hypothetical protein
MYTLDRVIIVVGDETGLCSWVYVVEHACLIICQVVNAPTFVTAMLVMLSQGAEVPEGDGSSLNPSRVGLAMPPSWFNSRAVRSIR